MVRGVDDRPCVTADQHLPICASERESEQQGEAGGILFRGRIERKDGECFIFFETEHVEKFGPRAGAQNVRLQQRTVSDRGDARLWLMLSEAFFGLTCCTSAHGVGDARGCVGGSLDCATLVCMRRRVREGGASHITSHSQHGRY